MIRMTLLGFGEAAQSIAAGLAEEGKAALSAFDVRFADPEASARLREQAEPLGVTVCDNMADAVRGADVVLSLVVGSAAEAVGRSAAPHLAPGQIFVDLNSISPAGKEQVGAAIGEGSGDFVEGAVMARVPPYRHRVPILLAGPAAERAAASMRAIGMDCEVVGDRIGQACAVKMIRSVIVKGVEALLIESLTAAERTGVTERILDSVNTTFPGIDWRKTATYYIGRTRLHGARRVTEMTEAAGTLEGIGIEPIMSTAITRTIEKAHRKFSEADTPSAGSDPDYRAMLAALARD